MSEVLAQITVLSGYGGKAAAAILVEYKNTRLLLDAGGSLEPDGNKGWDYPANLDAIIISHDHIDHSAGLSELNSDISVYATQPVLELLPAHLNLQQLPLKGEIEIQGIQVTVGQAGHSLGGVWMHLNIGRGVFYSGDFSVESELFNFDIPPAAELALVDASYGLYDESLAEGKEALSNLITKYDKVIMPVPPTGRALEIALWLTAQKEHDWRLGSDCLQISQVKKMNPLLFQPKMLTKLSRSQYLSKSNTNVVYRENAKIIISGDADGIAGEAGRLIEQSKLQAKASNTITVYTGYLPAKAKRDVKEGLAKVIRWNVHPRTRDIQWLIEQLKCQRCLPLFTPIADQQHWRRSVSDCLIFDIHIRSSNDINT